MGKYDEESELSDSDNDGDLQDEINALSRACLPSTASNGAPDCDFSDDDDDLELVRSIQEQYGQAGNDLLSLKPLASLPPYVSDDEDDDFGVLRAIQSRFSQYIGVGNGGATETKRDSDRCTDKSPPLTSHSLIASDDDDQDDFETLRAIQKRFSNSNGGNRDSTETKKRESTSDCTEKSVVDDPGCMSLGNESTSVVRCAEADPLDIDSTQNWGDSSSSSSSNTFPKVAQAFVEAIKKNRSCQKLIRTKLLHVEARMEGIKELLKRVKTLRDFQVRCKKKIARASSRKEDAYVQLFSAPTKRKAGSGKNLSPMFYGPLDNSHVAHYRDAFAKIPLSFHRERWSDEERENLQKGIKQQIQNLLLQESTHEESGYAGEDVDNIMSSIRNIEITPEVMRDFCLSGRVNWEQLASIYLPRRSGAECEARWLNFENPFINELHNKGLTEKEEVEKIWDHVKRNGFNNWSAIAEQLQRTPYQCLARYQSRLNRSMLKSEWSEEDDALLRSAVETYGESNWQAVASALKRWSGSQCANRWYKTLNPARERDRKWSSDEDKRLRFAATFLGDKRSWLIIEKVMPGRTQVQCRERWVNSLDPRVKWDVWTEEEDCKLEAAVKEHGHHWSGVAALVPGRTDNQCRRRWVKMNPEEAALHRAARNMMKSSVISNFVGRENYRPALNPTDFLPLVAHKTNCLTNGSGDDNAQQKNRNKRRRKREESDYEVPENENGPDKVYKRRKRRGDSTNEPGNDDVPQKRTNPKRRGTLKKEVLESECVVQIRKNKPRRRGAESTTNEPENDNVGQKGNMPRRSEGESTTNEVDNDDDVPLIEFYKVRRKGRRKGRRITSET